MDIFDDRKLLDYDTYEDYLDSFLHTDDIFYLRNRDFARINAALGYRLVLYGYLLGTKKNTIMPMHLDNVLILCSGHFYNARSAVWGGQSCNARKHIFIIKRHSR